MSADCTRSAKLGAACLEKLTKLQHPFLEVEKLLEKLSSTIEELDQIWKQGAAPSKKYLPECDQLADRIAHMFEGRVLSSQKE